MKKESIPVRNSLLLLLTATIWGVAFVAQSVSMDYIGGFTFNAVRNLIGALTLPAGHLGTWQNKSTRRKKTYSSIFRPQNINHRPVSAVVSCSALQATSSSLAQIHQRW